MAHKNHPGFSGGRTVKARDLKYVQRPADAELLDHCLNGRPAYILHSPQMGKSSLLAHTAEQLNATSHHAVLIDLSQFPLPPREEEWFYTIVRILDDSLDLTTDVIGWWKKPAVFAIPPHKRLTQLLTEVILPEIATPLVLFIDEIERIAPLPFREHFFDWLATLYESRETNTSLYRLSFVVCGVATPSQLIPDGGPLLFQWSHRVVLTDFTLQEALLLAEGLSLPTEVANETVEWIYRWTQGHPYLTQLLCQLLEEQNRVTWFEAEVDECIEHFIVSPQGLREPHFQFIRSVLTEPDANGISLLGPYLDLLEGRTENLQANPAALEQLRLVGVLGENEREITIRNRVYEEAFPAAWVERHLHPAPSVPQTPALDPAPTSPPVPEPAQEPVLTLSPEELPESPPESAHAPAPRQSYVMAASLFLLGVGLLVWFFGSPTNQSPTGPSPNTASVSEKSQVDPVEPTGSPSTPEQREALAQAQEKIQELEATIVRYQQLSDDEEQVRLDQRTQLETKLAFKDETIADLQTQVQALASEAKNQQQSQAEQIATLQTEREQLVTKAQTSAKDLKTALEEVKTLQMAVLKKSALSPAETAKLLADRSQLDTQLKNTNTALAVAHERVRNLEAQLTQQEQVAQVGNQERLEDRAQFETTIKELESTIVDTRQMLAAKETTAREQAKLAQSELNRLQQDRSRYQELLAATQEELASAKTHTVNLESSLSQKDQAIQKEREAHTNLTAELQDLRSQETQRTSRLAQLEALLADQQKNTDSTITTLRQERDQLTTELHDLRSQETQTASRLKQLETLLAQQRKNADTTLAVLQQERDQLQTQLGQTQQELNSVKTQVATLGDQLSVATSQADQKQNALQEIHSSSSEQVRRSEEKAAKLALLQSTLQTQLEASQTALLQTKEQLALLEKDSAKASATQATLQKTTEERDQYSKKLEQTSQELLKAQDKIKNLEQSLVALAPTTNGRGTGRALSSTSPNPNLLGEQDIVNVVSTITSKLTQSSSPIQSATERLLWARQAYELNLRTPGTQWATIDSSLREGLRASPIQLKGVSSKIHSLAFDPSGNQVIGGTSNGTILLWSVSQPLQLPQEFTGHSAGILSVIVSPDGQLMASGSLDTTIRLWDPSQPTTRPRILQAHKKGVTSLAFRPDGKQLASGSQDHTILLWDLTNEALPPVTLGSHASRINAIAYTPDGKTLLSGGDDLTLRVWDLQRKDSSPKVLRGHQQSISTIAIHPSGWMVATGSRDRQIGVWDLRQSLIVPTFLKGSSARISQVKFSPTDGTSVASVGSDKTLRIWNWQDPAQSPIQFPGHKGTLEALAISPDGRTLAVGGSSKSVTLWANTVQLAHAVCDMAKENLSFKEWKKVVGDQVPYERTCPNLPLHPTFLEEGRKLAKQGARKEAQEIFDRAKQLDPYLKFDPNSELKKLSAKSS